MATLTQVLSDTADEAADLWVSPAPAQSVPRLDGRLLGRDDGGTAVTFLREYVAQNRPCIIVNALSNTEDWKATAERWTREYLVHKCANRPVHVNVTPNGWGDAVAAMGGAGDVFVKPEEREMTLRDFHSALDSNRAGERIVYLSHQDDNLRSEFPELLADLGSTFPQCLTTVAFGPERGAEPEAVNLWIGDECAVSSTHRDFYENLYCVVRGEKTFTLLPPCAMPFMHEQRGLDQARYVERTDGAWAIEREPDSPPVSWIPLDPGRPGEVDRTRYPRFAMAEKLAVHCSVRAGEVLFLPHGWLHRVSQTRETVSVNFWYDMPFGALFVLENAFERAVALLDRNGEAL